MPPATDRTRALEAWRDLLALHVDVGRGGVWKVRDQPGRRARVAALWPLTQVVAAGLHVTGLLGPDADGWTAPLLAVLESHRRGDGYDPYPGAPPRYFDDNAWVGLDLVQAHLVGRGDVVPDGALAAAERVWSVVAAGRSEDGAVRWVDRPGSPVNTCATGPALELGLRLRLLGAGPGLDELGRLDGALQARFRGLDGLYVDHVEPDGRVDPTLWSYNQGTPVGAAVLWWRLTGAEEHLDRALVTAEAALAHFGAEDRLWAQPPVFVAVMLRNLLALDAVRPVTGLTEAVDGYLDRVWETARGPDGRVDGGGIGRYDDGGVIDHAGLVQLLALRAWDGPRRLDIC